jgi:D-beta-D-heptose 7-phosphate kinase/D-beta-D-heptose 1-phosphate adenosyltransferase
VYDITGAGDMVLAMIGVCLADGVSPQNAIRLGNVAGGLEVEKVGCVNVTRDELRQELRRTLVATPQSNPKLITHDELTALGLLHRGRQEKVVFTNGCFDLLHVGHVTYLQQARALGDVLVVGVNSDSSVSRLKGPTRPVIKQQDRAALLAALACVDQVIVFDEDTPHEILHRLRPDVLVKGGTYTRDQVVGHEVVEAYGGQVCVTDMVDGISTTKILSSINSHALQGPHFTASTVVTDSANQIRQNQ